MEIVPIVRRTMVTVMVDGIMGTATSEDVSAAAIVAVGDLHCEIREGD